LLPNYQNLCPKCTQWLRRDAGTSFRGGARRVLWTPKIYNFSFFLHKSCLWNSVTAAKTTCYADL